jgi:hypothetical protein
MREPEARTSGLPTMEEVLALQLEITREHCPSMPEVRVRSPGLGTAHEWR